MEEQKAKKDITFILISGEPDVGKSRVCNRLHSMLSMNGTFTFLDKMHTASVDHIRYYEKDGKHIVVNSPSDNDKCMELFAEYLDTLLAQDGVRPDIIITSIREKGEPMYHMLALLQAIAEGTTNLEDYYNQKIASKQVHTDFAPTSISHHTFVLHL